MFRILFATIIGIFVFLFMNFIFNPTIKEITYSVHKIPITITDNNSELLKGYALIDFATKGSGNTYDFDIAKILKDSNKQQTYDRLRDWKVSQDDITNAVLANVGLRNDFRDSQNNLGSVDSMLDIFPIMTAIMILLFILRMFTGIGGAERRERIEIELGRQFGRRPHSQEELNKFMMRNIGVSFESTLKNCGYKEINYVSYIADNTKIGHEPIVFTRPHILTIDTNFNWVVVEKHEQYTLYKVIGVHKKMKGLDCLYLFGSDEHTHTPFMIRIPIIYENRKIEICRRWSIGANADDTLIEV